MAYPTKEQLDSKWWHRLLKVLRWVLTIGILVFLTWAFFYEYDYCLRYGRDDCDKKLLMALLITVGLALITYFGFWLIYKRIILYIVFGSKNK